MHAADLATARHLLRPRRVVVAHLAEAETLIDHLMLPGAGVNLYKEPDEPNVVTWGVPGERRLEPPPSHRLQTRAAMPPAVPPQRES